MREQFSFALQRLAMILDKLAERKQHEERCNWGKEHQKGHHNRRADEDRRNDAAGICESS